MTSWADLDDELARWVDAGRVAALWWRDDDAVAATPALDRLLALRQNVGVPIGLAVIPATTHESLPQRLYDEPPDVTVLQHGYAHQNHALAPDKSCELGPHRPGQVVIGELGTGQLALARSFGARFLPVLVPPWNRITPSLVPALPEIGYRALSAFGLRTRAAPVRGLTQVNTHVDPIAWRGDRRFAGLDVVLSGLVAQLRVRRLAAAASSVAQEPIGLLTHHLVNDDDTWTFLDQVWNRLRAHPGVRIVAPAQVFGS
jgi:hypothetical protein